MFASLGSSREGGTKVAAVYRAMFEILRASISNAPVPCCAPSLKIPPTTPTGDVELPTVPLDCLDAVNTPSMYPRSTAPSYVYAT